MSRAMFNRLLLAVHGQGDELETPRRRLTGYAHCTGGCHGGRRACDCTTGCVEFTGDVAPDAARTFCPSPLPEDERSRLKRQALYLSALLFGVLAGLLEAFGAAPFEIPR